MFQINKLIGLLLFLCAPLCAGDDLSESGELLDGVAAIVNEGVVMRTQLTEETSNIMRTAQAQGIPLPPADILSLIHISEPTRH